MLGVEEGVPGVKEGVLGVEEILIIRLAQRSYMISD